MLDLADKDNFKQTNLVFDDVAEALASQGYIVLPSALSSSIMADLQQRINNIPSPQWAAAGIGREQVFQLNTQIRSDKIVWLTHDNKVESAYLAVMEQLRQAINRRLFLGLFDYESHFSIFSKGNYYKNHIDSL